MDEKLLERLVAAHEELARNVGRIADQLTPTADVFKEPDRMVAIDHIKDGLNEIGSSLHEIAQAIPTPDGD